MYSPKYLAIFIITIVVVTGSFFCTTPSTNEPKQQNSQWLSTYDTSIHYVGMEECRKCHEPIYQTFIQTGMGKSFAPATQQKSAADFAHAIVYDKENDFYYRPFFLNDTLYIKEFRLEGKDTIHERTEAITYIIGSGQHTNSHLYNINGYLYQAPITFYTQKGKWDLAPGFENGASKRFNRIIESECMTCHNAYPQFVNNSQNKYVNIKHGIDCERCHGPGEMHVKEKMSGKVVDTSKQPDYTIVNPRRLSTDLQNNICQRCHLQGVAVLNDGKTFFDFRPGMQLSEVANVFMPKYAGADDKMIMASHVERMKQSNCYVNSGKMSCITCHNPHLSVKQTPRIQYTNACQKCHGKSSKVICTETETKRATQSNDCITCHMPRNGSIDIPHVAVTDHFIRKRPNKDVNNTSSTPKFLGLQCINNPKPDDITIGRAYLEFFERFNSSSPNLLDSAINFLNKQEKIEQSTYNNKDYIRAYFLKDSYEKTTQLAANLTPEKTIDPWTAYRIGEAYFKQGNIQTAKAWYQRAVDIWPYALDFQNKYGTCLLALQETQTAQKVFEYVLKENPKNQLANSQLGWIYMHNGNTTLAYDYLMRAHQLDPDHAQTVINLAVIYYQKGDKKAAQVLLSRLVRRHPENQQAQAMLADLANGS